VWRSIDDAGHTHFAKQFREIAATPASGQNDETMDKGQALEPSGEDKHV
jgi:hypothetical protein